MKILLRNSSRDLCSIQLKVTNNARHLIELEDSTKRFTTSRSWKRPSNCFKMRALNSLNNKFIFCNNNSRLKEGKNSKNFVIQNSTNLLIWGPLTIWTNKVACNHTLKKTSKGTDKQWSWSCQKTYQKDQVSWIRHNRKNMTCSNNILTSDSLMVHLSRCQRHFPTSFWKSPNKPSQKCLSLISLLLLVEEIIILMDFWQILITAEWTYIIRHSKTILT